MGKTEVGCRPLKYREIPSTVDVKMRAFRDNPFINYIFQPPPDAREPRVGKLCTFFYIECVYYVSQREAIAIDGGDGYITYGSASNALSPLRKMFRRMLQAVVFCFLVLIFMLAGTKEQRQRLKEARLKSHAAKDGAIGGQRDDMFAIDTLAVSPDKQGMGYGSALLQAVTSRGIGGCASSTLVLVHQTGDEGLL
ncbi:hypothetical protein BKA93DRAFT_784532 [Sparassis latifolia]